MNSPKITPFILKLHWRTKIFFYKRAYRKFKPLFSLFRLKNKKKKLNKYEMPKTNTLYMQTAIIHKNISIKTCTMQPCRKPILLCHHSAAHKRIQYFMAGKIFSISRKIINGNFAQKRIKMCNLFMQIINFLLPQNIENSIIIENSACKL